jgi:hypothetical protein
MERIKRRKRKGGTSGRISQAEFDKPRYLTREQLDNLKAEKKKR